ncbi:hypothetical protein [Aquipseudomonas alcaligenes]|uniref:hypothetical protein n=1 Tax=Aquipseudomonas alcaligenes TaxID=43263 RepID=UPI0035B122E1
MSVGVDQVHGRSIGDLPALRQPWSGAFPAAAAFGCNKGLSRLCMGMVGIDKA